MDPIVPTGGSPVVVVAVHGVPITWIGAPPLGAPGDGDLIGDGTGFSRMVIARVRELWEKPVQVDHPSWRRPVWTVGGHPVGVLATLLHLADGRGVVLQAPKDVLAEMFVDAEVDGKERDGIED